MRCSNAVDGQTLRTEMPNKQAPEGYSPDVCGLADKDETRVSSQINDSRSATGRIQDPAYSYCSYFALE